MDLIRYEDLTKVKLCLGTVMKAELHPKADRLLVLQVQLGSGEGRQIVAGIREHYTPASLVGVQVVVVINLEPVTIRGVESRGMLLAASDSEGLSLLTVDKPRFAGSEIR